ncbi:MAG: ribonuclease H-like domain-containing protein [Candidatus Promineifilaceae bacterium]|jgi:uncharacterized protein YprB with RNaseH-like and TPR domain
MSQELFERLRRLGLTRGARNLKPVAKPAQSRDLNKQSGLELLGDRSLRTLFPSGRLEESGDSACFIVDNVYPVKYKHGHSYLYDLLDQQPSSIAVYCQEERLEGLDFRDFVFLDTETTGLYGAGTIAFMVGIAFFETNAQGEVFVVRQFFLRDHDDELAMLQILGDFIDSKRGLITFNGHSFDLPLLENRYLMNRLPGSLRQVPHIDLLPFARRLWRKRFGSVALGNLEKELLAINRTEADVPGWLIPTIYNDYLRSQDARELRRVFYHNEIDMLSMVTLADYLVRLISNSTLEPHPIDLYSLGKWQADIGMASAAEKTLKEVLRSDLPLPVFHEALAKLGLLLKRQNRSSEAVPYWQQWAATSFDEVDAHVELAKFYEWHEKDLKKAERWTLEALSLVDSWSRNRSEILHAEMVRPELAHRLTRIQTKLSL